MIISGCSLIKQSSKHQKAQEQINYNTHSHDGVVHSHTMPKMWKHSHDPSTGKIKPFRPSNVCPQCNTVVTTSTSQRRAIKHRHNGVAHTHPLPEGGLSHSHNYNASSPVSTLDKTRSIAHSHNQKMHSHRLPSSGTNHTHNQGSTSIGNTYSAYAAGGTTNNNQGGGNTSYYDYSGDPTTGSNYYDYNGGSTTGSNYYNYGGTAAPSGNNTANQQNQDPGCQKNIYSEMNVQEMPYLPSLPGTTKVEDLTGQLPGITSRNTFKEVTDAIVRALRDASNGFTYRFFCIPDGIALVANMEQIKSDGKPFPENERFLQKQVLHSFSIADLIKYYFIEPGYSRVIVFVITKDITNIPYSNYNYDVTKIVDGGSTSLSMKQARKTLGMNRIKALIYTHRKPTKAGEAKYFSGGPNAKTHLMRSGVMGSLIKVLKR